MGEGSGHIVRGLGVCLEHLKEIKGRVYVSDRYRKGNTELISAAFCGQQGAMESI